MNTLLDDWFLTGVARHSTDETHTKNQNTKLVFYELYTYKIKHSYYNYMI